MVRINKTEVLDIIKALEVRAVKAGGCIRFKALDNKEETDLKVQFVGASPESLGLEKPSHELEQLLDLVPEAKTMTETEQFEISATKFDTKANIELTVPGIMLLKKKDEYFMIELLDECDGPKPNRIPSMSTDDVKRAEEWLLNLGNIYAI